MYNGTAAGILPKFFDIKDLIANVLSYPISTALIGLGTMDQVTQGMVNIPEPSRNSFSHVVATLERAFIPIPCDRCQRCKCPEGIEVHVLLRQFNYFFLGKDRWALRKLDMNIKDCVKKCGACLHMTCVRKCPREINIPIEIEGIGNLVERFYDE